MSDHLVREQKNIQVLVFFEDCCMTIEDVLPAGVWHRQHGSVKPVILSTEHYTVLDVQHNKNCRYDHEWKIWLNLFHCCCNIWGWRCCLQTVVRQCIAYGRRKSSTVQICQEIAEISWTHLRFIYSDARTGLPVCSERCEKRNGLSCKLSYDREELKLMQFLISAVFRGTSNLSRRK